VALTHYLGFKPDSDEYKVMAMASMGKETAFYDKFKEIVRLNDDGLYQFDLSYFNFPKGIRNPWVSQKFIDYFGPLRERPNDVLVNRAPLEERHYDIAFALQKRLEDVAVHMANHLYSKNPCDNLLVSGGVALNCVMNETLRTQTPYKNVWTMSAPHDAGTSLGSAYFLYHSILKKPRKFIYKHSSWGPSFENDAIEKEIKLFNSKNQEALYFKKLPSEEIAATTVEKLLDGKIIGWFQGRTEFGPRALGNRSILADPRKKEMKDKINAKIKHREAFRPFAPAILKERAHEYFDINTDQSYPFMSHVVKAKKDKEDQIQAVVHFDGTSRIQTVEKTQNPRFYELLKTFEEKTSVPVLLNTSFNDNGEPIVNSPKDALQSFQNTNLDCLFIGDYFVEKK
jgi:carbamoyltransferase